jgi:hypothetical protein
VGDLLSGLGSDTPATDIERQQGWRQHEQTKQQQKQAGAVVVGIDLYGLD